jgi:predicted acylesterase/phospholipase RssA
MPSRSARLAGGKFGNDLRMNPKQVLPTPPVSAIGTSRATSTLVLPGGGARGAYQAGAIEGLRQAYGLSDGDALPGVSAVIGTSIGAINGWFVATARYSQLAEMWRSIASSRIFRVKQHYAATRMPTSAVLTRIFQAALVDRGLSTHPTGLLDSGPIHRWLASYIGPSIPLVTTFLFTLTNSSDRRSEIFYRMHVEPIPANRAEMTARLNSLFANGFIVREIEDAHLVAAIAGSSAVPILLDPVTINFADGPRTYIDGGIADSAPLDLARVFANRVELVLVDHIGAVRRRFPNTATIASVTLSITHSRVLEESMRAVYRKTRKRRLARPDAGYLEQRSHPDDPLDVELQVMRPEGELPVQIAGFEDSDGIAKSYELGRQAGLRGFYEYDPGGAVA